jgi:uncharacterized membrane-anchored protein
MKSLYDKNHRYTPEATLLSSKISEHIFTVVKQYVADGYSPREISHIILHEVLDAELMAVMGVPK